MDGERARRRAGRRVLGARRAPGANMRVFQPPPSRREAVRRRRRARARARGGRARAPRPPRPSRARRRRCVGPRSYSSTGSPERSTPSAASSSSARANGSHVGIGCSIQPKTIAAPSRSSSTGTTPAPVSSRSTIFCSGPPSTNAAPSVGCPANGSSAAGVKIRIRTSASSACGGSTNTVSEKLISLRERLHRQRVEIARVGEHRELVPRERRVGEDVGDDVAEAAHGDRSRPRRLYAWGGAPDPRPSRQGRAGRAGRAAPADAGGPRGGARRSASGSPSEQPDAVVSSPLLRARETAAAIAEAAGLEAEVDERLAPGRDGRRLRDRGRRPRRDRGRRRPPAGLQRDRRSRSTGREVRFPAAASRDRASTLVSAARRGRAA